MWSEPVARGATPRAAPAARAVCLLGTGHAVPSGVLKSEAVDHRLGLAPGAIERLSGVRQRPVASRTDTAARLGAQAARCALEAAGLGLGDIDCLVAASGTMDQGMPSNAALIHRELGLRGVPGFDVNASCLGFIAALDTLSWAVQAGRYRRVLVVAADIASCGLDWNHLEASAIFGDGAAAAVLAPSGDGVGGRILAADLLTISEGAHLCQIPAGGSRHHPTRIDGAFEPLALFHMDGPRVFKLATRYLPDFLDRLLGSAGVTLRDIDWVVPHQASRLAMTHLSRRLGIAGERVVDIFSDHGNQIAASLPTALDTAVRDGRIRRGHRLLLLGTGAGLSLGGVVMEF